MLWKIFSILAAIALAAGVYFSIENRKSLQAEKDLAKRHVTDLDSAQRRYKAGVEAKERRDKELAESNKKLAEVEAEHAKIKADTEIEKRKVDVVKRDLEEVNKQLAELEDQINKAGDIKKLLAKVNELKTEQVTADTAIANQKQQLALAEERLTKITSEIARLEEVDKRQRSGEVEPGFTARITQPYTNFGFVILNKGNLGGMFAKANLQVIRRNNVIAKLTVRDVEQAMSVADLVPGSMAPGESIRSGDLVVPAPQAAAAPAPAPDPSATPTPTPTPGGAPEPFAPPTPGMASPTPAPTTPDPFGAAPPPGGMAPAPTPPANDPFGAPPAPAPAPAPAPTTPPATTDPFAPPPAPAGAAPAPGATPAPAPAPAPTTPPAAADPFAPPPAGGATPPPVPPPPAKN